MPYSIAETSWGLKPKGLCSGPKSATSYLSSLSLLMCKMGIQISLLTTSQSAVGIKTRSYRSPSRSMKDLVHLLSSPSAVLSDGKESGSSTRDLMCPFHNPRKCYYCFSHFTAEKPRLRGLYDSSRVPWEVTSSPICHARPGCLGQCEKYFPRLSI